MVTLVCDKTGIAFEAASKRQKNHPKVSSFLNYAASTKCQRGAYGVALEEFATCKAEQMTDIDAVLARVRGVVEEFNQTASEAEWHRIKLEKERKRQRAARYQERQYTNSILGEGGYHWINLLFEDEEEADAFGLIGPTYEHLIGKDWHLYSRDDREVSVRQAMQEMTDAGNIRAKIWLKEHEVTHDTK